MEEARMANNSFPETEGWATIGEIIANIGRVGIPVAAGAAFAPAGIAAGIANVASSVAESHAQAQMELDNFEQETGQRLTDGQRTGFVAICMGADLLFDTILQSRYLKNLKSGAKKKASEYFKKTILKNQTAQTEISKIMSKLSKTDKSALIAGTFNDAVTGGTAEALNSVAHDMAKTIYNEPGQYPTLESILQNATTGMVSGSLGGAALGYGTSHQSEKEKYAEKQANHHSPCRPTWICMGSPRLQPGKQNRRSTFAQWKKYNKCTRYRARHDSFLLRRRI